MAFNTDGLGVSGPPAGDLLAEQPSTSGGMYGKVLLAFEDAFAAARAQQAEGPSPVEVAAANRRNDTNYDGKVDSAETADGWSRGINTQTMPPELQQKQLGDKETIA